MFAKAGMGNDALEGCLQCFLREALFPSGSEEKLMSVLLLLRPENN